MALMLIINGIATFIPPYWLFWASRVGIVLSGFGVLPAIWRQVKEDEAGWSTWLTALAFLGLSAEGCTSSARPTSTPAGCSSGGCQLGQSG